MNDKKQTVEESIKPDIRPEFLVGAEGDDGKNGDKKGGGIGGAVDKAAAAKSLLGAAEKGASAMSGTGGKAGFVNSVGKKGKTQGNKKKPKSGLKKALKARGATFAIFGVVLAAIPLVVIAVPVVVLGTLDYKLQSSIGIDALAATMEEQAEYVVKNGLLEGSFNPNYADDLASNGIEVGQVTAIGEFVRTNTYLANLDKDGAEEIAASGEFRDNSNGELVIKFEDKLIAADDLISELETNPRLYAAFAKATDIKARFWYDQQVDDYLKEEFGAQRNEFSNYRSTGNAKKDKEQVENILRTAISNVATVGLNGYDDECSDDSGEGCARFEISNDNYSGKEGGEELAKAVANSVKGENAIQKGASLLNAAVSANEPYIAAKTYLSIEEVLNRARIDGDGPVDPMLNILSEKGRVVVTNAETHEDMVVDDSVLSTYNFVATVSNHSYSVKDAENYSRDGIVEMIDDVSSDTIKKTTLATDSPKKFNILVAIKGNDEANTETISRTKNRLSSTFYDDTLTVTKSAIGGNRVVMGGSFFLNSVMYEILGARASDKEAIQAYKKETDKIIARKAEAERATLSPFDVSSENTFLGGLVGKIGEIATRNVAKGGSLGNTVTSSVANLLGESLNTLTTNDVLAEADDSFLNTFGNCRTVKAAAGVEGDLYCTQRNTIDTTRMNWTIEDYKNAMPGAFDSDGGIVENSEYGRYLKYSDRQTTVGIKDATVCERWKEDNQSLLGKIGDALSNILGLYNSCRGVDDDIAIGIGSTLSKENENYENVSIYSSYALYDKVSSLLNEKKSSVAEFKEKYYAEHPLDKSAAGVISRRSGMSKAEAEVALAYYSYLDYIAHYRPEERYAFIDADYGLSEMMPGPIVENQRLQAELAIASREVFYRDLRTLATFSI